MYVFTANRIQYTVQYLKPRLKFKLFRGPKVSPLVTRGVFLYCTNLIQHTRPQPVILCAGEGPITAASACRNAHTVAISSISSKRDDIFHLDPQQLGRLVQKSGAETRLNARVKRDAGAAGDGVRVATDRC